MVIHAHMNLYVIIIEQEDTNLRGLGDTRKVEVGREGGKDVSRKLI